MEVWAPKGNNSLLNIPENVLQLSRNQNSIFIPCNVSRQRIPHTSQKNSWALNNEMFGMFLHLRESQSNLGWKGPLKVIQSNLLAGFKDR